MRVAIADPDIDIEIARQVLSGTGAEVTFEAVNWTGDDIVAFIVSPEGEIRASDLERCPNLKIVVTTSTGADNVDVAECQSRGVQFWHPTDYCSDEVADTAIALLLGLLRGTVFLDRSVRAGSWHYDSAGLLKRADDTRLGILGFGTIGQKVAMRARVLRMAVSTYDPIVTSDTANTAGAKLVGLDELFETSSAISIHVPLNSSTHNLVSEQRISLVPRGSILVNLARGEIVDTSAVLSALTTGQLFGAALDVLTREPPTKEFPAPQHPRLVVTPHAGWYSERSANALFVQPLEIIRDVLK